MSALRWVTLLVATAVSLAALAVRLDSGAAAPQRELTFLARVKGTADVTLQANGNLFGGRGGCHADAVADGRESFSFSSVIPQRVTLFPNGRGVYYVNSYERKRALRVVATRVGTYTVTFPASNPDYCYLTPQTLTAPATGCGTASHEAGSTLLVGGVTGSRGRSRPYIDARELGYWGFEYSMFPWFKRLDPCPSGMNALGAEHMGTAWSGGRRLWLAGGGRPYEKSGDYRVRLPAHFWTKNEFVVKNRFVWSFRALGMGGQIGKETHTISWTVTFTRKR